MRRQPSSGRNPRKSRAAKEQRARTLIVCGAQQTEPNYFKEYLSHKNVHKSLFRIEGLGVTPGRLVKYAAEIQRQELQQGEKFDHIFCVFDKDDFDCFFNAVAASTSKGYVPITSTPCFEYWFLLHLKQSDAPIGPTGNKTSGQKCESMLRELLPAYAKNDKGVFVKISDGHVSAMEYSSRKFDTGLHGNNPSSNVHELIKHIDDITERYKNDF